MLTNESALHEFDLLSSDSEAQLSQVKRALAAQFAPGSAQDIQSASGLQFSAGFERPVRRDGVTVAEYSASMLVGELPSTEVGRIALMATTFATRPVVGAAPIPGEPAVRVLIQRDNSWLNPDEYALNTNHELELADGFWDAFRGCLSDRCGSVCLGALATCLPMGALPAVLGCLAVTCGGCAARCAACVACDCGWLCSAVVGCCHS